MVVTKTRLRRRATAAERAALPDGRGGLSSMMRRLLSTPPPPLLPPNMQGPVLPNGRGVYERSPRTNRLVYYSESDGEPISDNTRQFRWIQTLFHGLEALYADKPDVFVAGNLLWYAVQGDPKERIGPDVMVALGRPKGDRGSYMQWREGNIPPQIVIEVLSEGNSTSEMEDKRQNYERYGVLEYYVYDPAKNTLEIWERPNRRVPLARMLPVEGWISPRMRIKFDLLTVPDSMTVYNPDGTRFRTYAEVLKSEQILREERDATILERDTFVETLDIVAQQLDTAERERDAAAEERDAVAQERDAARRRAEKLAEKLRALGVDLDDEAGED